MEHRNRHAAARGDLGFERLDVGRAYDTRHLYFFPPGVRPTPVPDHKDIYNYSCAAFEYHDQQSTAGQHCFQLFSTAVAVGWNGSVHVGTYLRDSTCGHHAEQCGSSERHADADRGLQYLRQSVG